MTKEAREILKSLEKRDDRFKAEVEKARAFRGQLEGAGVSLKRDRFNVPLMQRLETLSSPMLSNKVS